MDKKLNKIRKSIKARKFSRHRESLHEQKNIPKQLISDEERHGIQTDLIHHTTKSKKSKQTKSRLASSFFYQLFGAVALFLGSIFIIKGDFQLLNKPEALLRSAYEETFPFATVHDWYVRYLGMPLALLPKTEQASSLIDQPSGMPLNGEVVESFSTNGTGIHIMPENETYVQAVNKGVVIFAGTNSETDKTIIIQHADRSETTYGKLTTIDVHLYQLVDMNQVIGTINPEETEETLFFSIEQNARYVDPVKVINVDGSP